MVSQSSQNLESFVPVYDVVPEKWEEARQFLVEHLKKISQAVNVREIGFFLEEELLSGGQFIPSASTLGANSADSNQFRGIFRKVVDCGSLPNTGTKTVPHGITVDANFTLLHIYGAASRPSTLTYIPLPFSSNTPGQPVELVMNATDIIITTSVDLSLYTRTFVTIEYIKEV